MEREEGNGGEDGLEEDARSPRPEGLRLGAADPAGPLVERSCPGRGIRRRDRPVVIPAAPATEPGRP